MADTQREYTGNTDSIDFSDGLGETFGVEDTTIIAKNQLDSFLMNEPITQLEDVNSIQRVEDQPKSQSQNQPTQDTQEDKAKQQLKLAEEQEAQKEKASSSLKDWLLSDGKKEDDNQDTNKRDTTQQTDKQQENEEQNQDSSQEENQYAILSRDLYRLGVFTPDEDEEGNEIQDIADTPEKFLEKFQQEKKRGAAEMIDNFLERFGDDYKRMFDSVFVKGVNPKDYLASFTKMEGIKNMDLSVESNQEKIFVQYYRDQGLSEERIQKRLEKAKDYGDLADEAQELHELLVQKEERELAQAEVNKQRELYERQQRENAYQQNVNKILQNKLQSGDFDGIPVNKKEAQETFYYMTHKPYKLPDGKLITEMEKDWLELDKPENHELKVKVALLLKNKMDLSKVQKKAVSNKTDSLFTSITSKKTAQNRKDTAQNQPKSFFS